MLEDKIQNPSKLLFQFSLTGNVMDLRIRSGGGRFSGRIKNLRDQLRATISRISKSWNEKSPLLQTRSSRTPISRRRSVSRNRKLRKRIGFYEEDRSPSWSTTTFEWMALMVQFSITLIYFPSLFVMIMFRNLTQDGTALLSMTKIFIRWYIGESVQIEITSVWSTQNRIGIVRHGN